MTTVLDLPERIASLPSDDRRRVVDLFDVRRIDGRTDPPAEMTEWLTTTFGSPEAVRAQRLLTVANRVTLESAILAPLRGRRPMDGSPVGGDRHDGLRRAIEATRGDPFCDPLRATPADVWGRVRGRRMVTGANAGLADRHHAVLVFDEHDPLAFDADLVDDLFATGRRWADRSRESDPDATRYTLLWNCGWRAGGSIAHGHGQVLLGAGPPFGALERFRRAAQTFDASTGRSLADELVAVHRSLELAVDAAEGVATVAHLTPVKEREVLVIGPPGSDERDVAFVRAVARAVLAYRDRLDVTSFNLILWRPPLVAEPGWGSIGPIVRLVDRGDPFSRPSDIGAMELYASPIVGADPYDVVAALREG